MSRASLLLLAILFCLVSGTRANAHLTPNSEVRLDFGSDHVLADIIIPLGEYAVATGNPTTNDQPSLERAKAFLTQHVTIRSPDGRAWAMRFQDIGFVQIAGPPDLHATVRLLPPPGAPVRRLVIDWRAVIAQVPNHFVLVVLGSDFSGGRLEADHRILGALQGERRSLVIDRGETSLWSGFRAAFLLGMRHIAEGHDHLLFLIALLLPAPLLASAGRWAMVRSGRSTMLHLATIVSAFTIGHSFTLIGAAAFDWALPARPVEMLIALSILFSAIHALRPLFPGREGMVAAGFGLVHGLAFATVVGHFGLGAQEKALAIVGFNLGIEAVQLLVVAAILPSLLLLAPTRWFVWVRIGGGILAMLAALIWLAERWRGETNSLGTLMEHALAQSVWLIAALTIAGLLVRMPRPGRLRDGPAP